MSGINWGPGPEYINFDFGVDAGDIFTGERPPYFIDWEFDVDTKNARPVYSTGPREWIPIVDAEGNPPKAGDIVRIDEDGTVTITRGLQ